MKIDIDAKEFSEILLHRTIVRAILLFGKEIEKVEIANTRKGKHIRIYLQRNSDEIFQIYEEPVVNHFLLEMILGDDVNRVILNTIRFLKEKKATDYLFSFKMKYDGKEIVFSNEENTTIYEINFGKSESYIEKYKKTIQKQIQNVLSEKVEEFEQEDLRFVISFGLFEKIERKGEKFVVYAPKEILKIYQILKNRKKIREIFENQKVEIMRGKDFLLYEINGWKILLREKMKIENKEIIEITKYLNKKIKELLKIEKK